MKSPWKAMKVLEQDHEYLVLASSIPAAGRIPVTPVEPLPWPSGRAAPAAPLALEPPPDFFAELARQVAVESRGEATLAQLSVRRGSRAEWRSEERN